MHPVLMEHSEDNQTKDIQNQTTSILDRLQFLAFAYSICFWAFWGLSEKAKEMDGHAGSILRPVLMIRIV